MDPHTLNNLSECLGSVSQRIAGRPLWWSIQRIVTAGQRRARNLVRIWNTGHRIGWWQRHVFAGAGLNDWFKRREGHWSAPFAVVQINGATVRRFLP